MHPVIGILITQNQYAINCRTPVSVVWINQPAFQANITSTKPPFPHHTIDVYSATAHPPHLQPSRHHTLTPTPAAVPFPHLTMNASEKIRAFGTLVAYRKKLCYALSQELCRGKLWFRISFTRIYPPSFHYYTTYANLLLFIRACYIHGHVHVYVECVKLQFDVKLHNSFPFIFFSLLFSLAVWCLPKLPYCVSLNFE